MSIDSVYVALLRTCQAGAWAIAERWPSGHSRAFASLIPGHPALEWRVFSRACLRETSLRGRDAGAGHRLSADLLGRRMPSKTLTRSPNLSDPNSATLSGGRVAAKE